MDLSAQLASDLALLEEAEPGVGRQVVSEWTRPDRSSHRRSVEFAVRGLPVPQGSSRAFVAGGRAVLVSKSRPLADWRAAIAAEARAAMGASPSLPGPVAVRILAIPAERPASHFLPANGRRPVRVLRADAPAWNASLPDADKLARSTLDSLTGVVFGDDRQVADLRITTRWPSDGEHPGIAVRVTALEETR